jgi:hypothetical protein
MDRRLAKAADAVEELSRMHMTALESAAFFTDVQFLTDPDRSEAARKFRGYLASAAGGGGGGAPSFGAALALLSAGFLGGIIVANIGAAPATGASAAAAGSLFKYPLALFAVAGLGFVYAIAGLALEALGGSITSSAAAQARDEALDSLRAAFVAGNAPRIDAIIRRIEDAMDVYKARLGQAGAGSASAHHAASPAEDELAWRRAPEGPRFVAQSFLAAPESFRADPVAAPQRRFFSSKRSDDAAPKQSFSGDETPPWLKE